MSSIRDPIWHWINIENHKNIIDDPYFQRLRYIPQTTGMTFAFPSANHTRFSHSIGVMHSAGYMAQHLNKLHPEIVTDDMVIDIKEASLLHDIAHGPFSHLFDETVYNKIYHSVKGHDIHRFKLLNNTSLCNKVVNEDAISNIWNGYNKIGYGILSGPFGADRLDFLRRDGYFCGLTDGFEPSRIMSSIDIIRSPETDEYEIIYPEKVVDDMIQILFRRLWLYENVYYHKISLSSHVLLDKIVHSCVEPLNLIERTVNTESFLQLTDERILIEAENVVPDLVRRLRYRDLPDINITSFPKSSSDKIFRRIDMIDLDKFKRMWIRLNSGSISPLLEYMLQCSSIQNRCIEKYVTIA